MGKKRKKNTVLIIIAGVLAAILLLAVFGYMAWEKPPEVVVEETPVPETEEPTEEAEIPVEEPEPTPTPEPIPEGAALETERQDGVYTILLAGRDITSGNTDTILVGRFDTVNHVLNLVSIPRDTLLNIGTEVRKINSIYTASLNTGGNGIDSLLLQVQWLTGFRPDCYAVLDLNTFVEVIDELGGVDFDVPEEMEYMFFDIAPRLYVHLYPGMQHLDGLQAMTVCRYRESYISGDYGRIEMQHEFMKACADQFIRLGNIPHARTVIKILSENLDTNLSAANIAWFMRQLMLCISEDIRMYTIPSEPRSLMGYSYSVVMMPDWLTMINGLLNPLGREIGWQDLNLVYINGDGFGSTQGYFEGDWYFSGYNIG